MAVQPPKSKISQFWNYWETWNSKSRLSKPFNLDFRLLRQQENKLIPLIHNAAFIRISFNKFDFLVCLPANFLFRLLLSKSTRSQPLKHPTSDVYKPFEEYPDGKNPQSERQGGQQVSSFGVLHPGSRVGQIRPGYIVWQPESLVPEPGWKSSHVFTVFHCPMLNYWVYSRLFLRSDLWDDLPDLTLARPREQQQKRFRYRLSKYTSQRMF